MKAPSEAALAAAKRLGNAIADTYAAGRGDKQAIEREMTVLAARALDRFAAEAVADVAFSVECLAARLGVDLDHPQDGDPDNWPAWAVVANALRRAP